MTLALPNKRPIYAPRWAINELWKRAQAIPSLDLNFAASKSLADTVTGQSLVTFTRASSGTYVGSDGLIKTATTNEPRFDHSPTTGESLGLLVEEQRTNNHLRSDDVSNWGTPSNATVINNAGTAPDGTSTADKLAENTANSEHFLSTGSLNFSYTSGTVYTRSCWLKADGRIYATLYFPATNFPSAGRAAIFNLSTGTVHATESGVTAAISAFPNNWYRCSITVAATSTGSGHSGGSALRDDSVATVYTGDGTSGVLIWGAQLEAGAFPTSYIPTTTATVTRSADVASITGTNFSSWYRQDEGTVFAQCITPSTVACGFMGVDNGTSSERWRLGHTGTSAAQFAAVDSNVVQASLNTPASSFALASLGKAAAAYALNDFTLYANASATATPDTSGTLPTPTQATIGTAISSQSLNGTIRRLTFWPQRLSDSTLQTITQ